MSDKDDPADAKSEAPKTPDKDDDKRPAFTVAELVGKFGPPPDGMTAVDLAREARQIGSRSRWDRYLAQRAEEEAAHEI